jgi:hypothetical protein
MVVKLNGACEEQLVLAGESMADHLDEIGGELVALESVLEADLVEDPERARERERLPGQDPADRLSSPDAVTAAGCAPRASWPICSSGAGPRRPDEPEAGSCEPALAESAR